MKKFFAAFTLLALLAWVQLHAEIMGASSIEWLSCKADVILIGQVSKIDATKTPRGVVHEDCTVQISQLLKGEIVDKELVLCLRDLSDPARGQALMNSKDGVLLFLSKSKAHGSEPPLDNQYFPSSMSYPLSVIDLSNIPTGIYSKEMEILRDKESVLNVARKWMASKISDSLLMEVPADSPVLKELHAGSSCYLIVPAEEKYRSQFIELARSDKPYERQKAASELRKYPGEETEQVLRDLLKDNSENVWTSAADTITKVDFGVRTAACRSLGALNKPVPEGMVLTREPTQEERRALRESQWKKAFTEALSEGWSVTSVEDGETFRVEERDTTSVIITCSAGDSTCIFTLIPKEWKEKDFPNGGTLGINGKDSQGARRFFLNGKMPKNVKEKLVQYFGLE